MTARASFRRRLVVVAMLTKYGYVGERIRRERLKYRLSLSDVARATGLSQSFLSLLENGKVIPSVKVLDKIASFFSIHIATLFEQEESNNTAFLFPKERQIEVSSEKERSLRFLLPKANAVLEPVLVTLYPNATNLQFTVHRGMEYGYVLEGTITVEIKGHEPLTCCEGDSILYRAADEHRLVNYTDSIAKGLWVGVPTPGILVDVPSQAGPAK